jgi:hypothetical protein
MGEDLLFVVHSYENFFPLVLSDMIIPIKDGQPQTDARDVIVTASSWELRSWLTESKSGKGFCGHKYGIYIGEEGV